MGSGLLLQTELSFRLSVGLSVTTVSHAKTGERIEMLFSVGSSNHITWSLELLVKQREGALWALGDNVGILPHATQ